MLAQEMLVQHMLGRGLGGRVDGQGQDRHFRDLLQHSGVVDGLRSVTPPSEGAVAGAEHTGHVSRVDASLFKCLDDDFAGVFLVVLVDLFGRQLPRAGHCAVEIIGVGRAEGGQVAPRLRKGDCVGRVGMHDAAQLRKRLVQFEMGLRVAAGVEVALDLVAVQIQHDKHFGRQVVVFHAGGLDDEQSLLPVDARHIAPSIGHEPPPGQLHVGLVDLLFEFF